MERKKQRIVSIIIGVILAVLLITIGVRFVQRRASKASQPESITAQRVDADTCKVSAVTSTDEPLLIKYGSTTPTFFYRIEPSQIAPQGNGKYLQEAQIDQVGEEQVTFTVENFENISTICEPFSNTAGTQDTTANNNVIPTEALSPTAALSEEPSPTQAPEITKSSVEKEGLSMEKATTYYQEHPDAFISACVDEFKDTYMGLAQICGAAYQKHKADSSE